MKCKSIFIILNLLWLKMGWAFSSKPVSIPPTPPVPYYYVLDESKTLDSHTLHALQSLLIEHDQLTGQQIMIALMNGKEGVDLRQWAHQIFSEWKVGKRGQDDGLLLVVFLNQLKAQVEVGYGLDSTLTEDKIKEVLSDYLYPQLKRKHISVALNSTTFHLLEALDSPLIKSGKAIEIIRSDGVHLHGPSSDTSSGPAWGILLLFGTLMLIAVLSQILAREAHFTRSGWYRPYPFDFNKLNWKNLKDLASGRRRDHSNTSIKGGPYGGSSGHW